MVAQSAGSPSTTADCVIVGAGPAGMVLGRLLARRGGRSSSSCTATERDFRRDPIPPSTMEMLHGIGLAEDLHWLRHGKLRVMRFVTPPGHVESPAIRRLKTRFPYIKIAPQARFPEFLHQHAQRYPHFSLAFHASVEG